MSSTSQAVERAAAQGREASRIWQLWNGGASPFAVPNLKLGMWIFLASDTLTFGALLAGYGAARLAAPTWPDRIEAFGSLWLVTTMTFILICSSATMATAVGAARRKDKTKAVQFLLLTIAGGLFFVLSQAYEWTHLIEDGARLFANPWGSPLFSACFFVITGFHGLHVSVGVVYLSVLAVRAFRNKYSDIGVEVAGLYWHFVDLVWVFIFTLFYLL